MIKGIYVCVCVCVCVCICVCVCVCVCVLQAFLRHISAQVYQIQEEQNPSFENQLSMMSLYLQGPPQSVAPSLLVSVKCNNWYSWYRSLKSDG
jgi:hypothetical protein